MARLIQTILSSPIYVAYLAGLLFAAALIVIYHKPARFILKSLFRNKVRTVLTGMAVFVLVVIVTLIWSVLWFLDLVTTEKAKDLKAIVTERWQFPSRMPFAYAADLSEGAASKPGDIKPLDSMTWQFFGGTLTPPDKGGKRDFESLIFFFCMEPSKLLTMMDGIKEEMSDAEIAQLKEAVRLMEADKRRVIIGKDRLARMNKRVGERISIYAMPGLYDDIVLDECEIIAAFPDGRYNQSAVMHRDRLNDALDDYKRKKGKPHPMADKTLSLVWLKVPDTDAYNKLAAQIETSSLFTNPAVKCETASSGIASFLDAYRDLLWGMRWLLVPSILVTMALVIANAIGISVRERRTEMAVLKVLGYSPNQIMALVLGEALSIGCGAGLLSSGLTFLLVTHVLKGIKFPIAFFPAFLVPPDALWWGPLIGGLTALAGSFFPAWSARSVKVSEVFAKVT